VDDFDQCTDRPHLIRLPGIRRVLARRQIGYGIHYPILDCDQPAWRGRGRESGELIVMGLRSKHEEVFGMCDYSLHNV